MFPYPKHDDDGWINNFLDLNILKTCEVKAVDEYKPGFIVRYLEQKEAEQKEAEQKEAEQKEADKKEADKKEAEQKEADKKEAEQKEAEQKHSPEDQPGPEKDDKQKKPQTYKERQLTLIDFGF